MSEGGKGERCACVRVGTETDVNVEVVDLPHLTNHSDTLVGVQIDNCGGRNKSLNAVAHVQVKSEVAHSTGCTVRVHGRECMYFMYTIYTCNRMFNV